jgi:soluble lytic murein transglycosylase-like protein
VSASTLPIAAAGGGGPIAAAAERVQQLRALIAQVESGPSARVSGSGSGDASFASALGAASAGAEAPSATSAYTPAGLQAPASLPSAGALPPAAQYAAAGSAEPITVALQSTAAAGSPPGAGVPAASGADAGGAYVPLIERAAARYGLDPSILYGLIQQESGFDPSARSSAGALGLTQLMPSTAASLGVVEPLDPAQSIEGGARYLSQQLHQFAGNTADALAAYNAGPGAVQQYGGVPPYPETQQYVAKVLGYAAAYSQGTGQPAALATGAGATAPVGGGSPAAIPSEAVV